MPRSRVLINVADPTAQAAALLDVGLRGALQAWHYMDEMERRKAAATLGYLKDRVTIAQQNGPEALAAFDEHAKDVRTQLGIPNPPAPPQPVTSTGPPTTVRSSALAALAPGRPGMKAPLQFAPPSPGGEGPPPGVLPPQPPAGTLPPSPPLGLFPPPAAPGVPGASQMVNPFTGRALSEERFAVERETPGEVSTRPLTLEDYLRSEDPLMRFAAEREQRRETELGLKESRVEVEKKRYELAIGVEERRGIEALERMTSRQLSRRLRVTAELGPFALMRVLETGETLSKEEAKALHKEWLTLTPVGGDVQFKRLRELRLRLQAAGSKDEFDVAARSYFEEALGMRGEQLETAIRDGWAARSKGDDTFAKQLARDEMNDAALRVRSIENAILRLEAMKLRAPMKAGPLGNPMAPADWKDLFVKPIQTRIDTLSKAEGPLEKAKTAYKEAVKAAGEKWGEAEAPSGGKSETEKAARSKAILEDVDRLLNEMK